MNGDTANRLDLWAAMFWGGVLILSLSLVFGISALLPSHSNSKAIEKPQPLDSRFFGGHEWVTFERGGLYHHPDCPSQHPEPK